MALRTIGSGVATADFGTGDAAVLSKEVTIESTTDVAKKDGTGAVVGYIIGNDVVSTRETKYGAAADLTATALTGNVIRKTVSASNEDFIKITLESKDLVAS